VRRRDRMSGHAFGRCMSPAFPGRSGWHATCVSRMAFS
jgi:hypothetical protein